MSEEEEGEINKDRAEIFNYKDHSLRELRSYVGLAKIFCFREGRCTKVLTGDLAYITLSCEVIIYL